MAKLTNLTFLYYKEKGASIEATKLVDITSYPDLGGAPESVDVTTLSDLVQRNILGIQSVDAYEFGAWYEKDTYDKISKMKGTVYTWELRFGDEKGKDGIFTWDGQVSVYAGSGESNNARPMTLTISDEGDEPIHLKDTTAA